MADAGHTELPRPSAPRKPGVIANILAIIGFVILIIIVLWGVLHLISLITPLFSNLFTREQGTVISVTAPAQVASGTPLPISWNHAAYERGTYALMYQCTEGLSMTVGSTKIPCGAAFTLGNATGSATVLPSISGAERVNAIISVMFIPSAAGTTGPAASGSATVMITRGAATQTATPQTTAPAATPKPKPVSPKPAVSVSPQPASPKPVAAADLAVTILAVGVIDPYSGAFVQRAPMSSQETAAVQFDIQNIGGTHSGSYTFHAQIPTSQPYTYASPIQPSLAPGSHVVNTLRFSPAAGGNFSVQISGSDSRTSNNTASQWVPGAQMPYLPGYYPTYQY